MNHRTDGLLLLGQNAAIASVLVDSGNHHMSGDIRRSLHEAAEAQRFAVELDTPHTKALDADRQADAN